jgi:hypothetical protein
MMAQPRFLFVCAISGRKYGYAALFRGDADLDAGEHGDVARGDVGRADATCAPVAWRLLGGNNRELGRSPVWYPDFDACREALLVLKREIDGITPVITSSGVAGGAWSWRLAVGGRPVAMAGRPYHRHRECTYNLNHFVAAVPTAPIPDEICAAAAVRP